MGFESSSITPFQFQIFSALKAVKLVGATNLRFFSASILACAARFRWVAPLKKNSLNKCRSSQETISTIEVSTPLKTSMTLEKSLCSIGNTSLNGCVSIVMLVFGRVYILEFCFSLEILNPKLMFDKKIRFLKSYARSSSALPISKIQK